MYKQKIFQLLLFLFLSLFLSTIAQNANSEIYLAIAPIGVAPVGAGSKPAQLALEQSTSDVSRATARVAPTEDSVGSSFQLEPTNGIVIARSDKPGAGNSPSPVIASSPPSVIVSSPPSVIARSETTKQSLTLSKFRLTPRAGVYMPLGEDLQISYLGGLDLVWNVNQIVNLRFGAEYSNPGIENGNDLQIFKIPLMLVENENTPEQWGFKKLFYTGIGLVYMSAKYNNIEKQGLGGLFLIGRKFGDKFSAEAKFDALRKNEGYQFGGISIYLNYTY